MKLQRLIPHFLCLMLMTQLSVAQSSEAAFLSETISNQKRYVGKLTGHDPINDKIELGSRSSESEREIASEYLFDFLKDEGLDVKKQKYKEERNGVEYKGTNIYAVIDATDKTDEYLVIGAHYDSAKGSPGANNNATGVALVQVVASKLNKIENRSRNIVIVFLDQEQEGSIGSHAFIQKIKDRGEKAKVHSVHIIDQLGWDNDKDRAIELESPNVELEELYKSKSKLEVYRTPEERSAHKVFREAGYNTVGITEEYSSGDTSPYNNHRGDSFETVDFNYLGYATSVVLKAMTDLIK